MSSIVINMSTSSTAAEVAPSTYAAPVIKVNNLSYQPDDTPGAAGFQLVVFNVTQDGLSGLVTNYYLNFDMMGLQTAYTMLDQILLVTGNPNNQLVLLASFGLDMQMIPINETLMLLYGYGAGPQLQSWASEYQSAWTGFPWVSAPTNYLFVGTGNSAWGTGQEVYNYGLDGTVSASLNCTLTL